MLCAHYILKTNENLGLLVVLIRYNDYLTVTYFFWTILYVGLLTLYKVLLSNLQKKIKIFLISPTILCKPGLREEKLTIYDRLRSESALTVFGSMLEPLP